MTYYPDLAPAAARTVSLHATSCSIERLWGMVRWVYRDNRMRLGIARAKKMVFVAKQTAVHAVVGCTATTDTGMSAGDDSRRRCRPQRRHGGC